MQFNTKTQRNRFKNFKIKNMKKKMFLLNYVLGLGTNICPVRGRLTPLFSVRVEGKHIFVRKPAWSIVHLPCPLSLSQSRVRTAPELAFL